MKWWNMKWKELVAHDNIKGNKAREILEYKGWKINQNKGKKSANMTKICS
jgi:hypothetical protein